MSSSRFIRARSLTKNMQLAVMRKASREAFSGNSIPGMTIRTLPLNLSYSLIESCDDSADWTNVSGPGTYVTLVGDGPNGEDVIRIEATNLAGNKTIKKTPAVTDEPYKDGFFVQWVRFPDLAKNTKYFHAFWRNPFSSTGYYQRVGTANGSAVEARFASNEWGLVYWKGTNMAATAGAPAFASNTLGYDTIYMRGYADLVAGGQTDFGSLYGNVRSRPVVIFSFDDSNDTDYTIAYPYLAAKGLVGTTYTMRTGIDTANHMTVAQLQELQAAGWTVGTHGFDSLTTLSAGDLLTELTAARDYMTANSLTDWEHYSFPLGDFNPDVVAQLSALGYETSRTVENDSFPVFPGLNPYLTKGSGSSAYATAQDGKDMIDEAIQYGSTVEIYAHLLNSGGGGGQTDKDLWKAVVDYAHTKHEAGEITVMSKAQWWEMVKQTVNGAS